MEAPAAEVSVSLRGFAPLRGTGYAERILITIPPWRLPIRELRWGRWIGEAASRSVVWIDWRGESPAPGCSWTEPRLASPRSRTRACAQEPQQARAGRAPRAPGADPGRDRFLDPSPPGRDPRVVPRPAAEPVVQRRPAAGRERRSPRRPRDPRGSSAPVSARLGLRGPLLRGPAGAARGLGRPSRRGARPSGLRLGRVGRDRGGPRPGADGGGDPRPLGPRDRACPRARFRLGGSSPAASMAWLRTPSTSAPSWCRSALRSRRGRRQGSGSSRRCSRSPCSHSWPGSSANPRCGATVRCPRRASACPSDRTRGPRPPTAPRSTSSCSCRGSPSTSASSTSACRRMPFPPGWRGTERCRSSLDRGALRGHLSLRGPRTARRLPQGRAAPLRARRAVGLGDPLPALSPAAARGRGKAGPRTTGSGRS